METKIDASQKKAEANKEKMLARIEEIKSGLMEMISTLNAFQEKMDTSIANRKDD
jgi:hypothetical protein